MIQLINDILDLSKIESRFISTNISTVRISEIARLWRPHQAYLRHATYDSELKTDYALPTSMETDIQRLTNLEKLVGHAFKFTEKVKYA